MCLNILYYTRACFYWKIGKSIRSIRKLQRFLVYYYFVYNIGIILRGKVIYSQLRKITCAMSTLNNYYNLDIILTSNNFTKSNRLNKSFADIWHNYNKRVDR